MIKVIVNGAKGKMGSESVKAIKADAGLDLVAEADIGDDLVSLIKNKGAEVVLDFTTAAVSLENATKILKAGARPVVGTSGFTHDKVEALNVVSREVGIGGLVVPNFAIGAVLMMKFGKEIAKYMPQAEIIELHHDKKADFPSGTAVRTAELIAEGRAGGEVPVYSEEDQRRGVHHFGVPIHSVRLQGFIAHQEIIFGGLGQVLTLRHDSISRESFMPGVVLACKKVMGCEEIVYGLENVL